MANDAQEIITEGWSDEPVLWPEHTRLYHLEPIGMGTPWVESLTSYVTRLAAAHSVPPRKLLVYELAPYLHRAAQAKTDVLRNGAISRLLSFSGSLNGISSLTQQMVDGLSVLTGRNDLHCLTLLPLREIFSQVKLLRRVRAWCPWCFASWQEAGSPIYEPLLWKLETLDICPLHGPLSTHCPYPDCARTSVCLTAQSSVGFCARCQRWLGVPPSWHRPRGAQRVC